MVRVRENTKIHRLSFRSYPEPELNTRTCWEPTPRDVFSCAMILALSKVLPALIFPAGLAILLCLCAAWLALRKGARAAGALSLLAALVLYIAASPLVSNRLMRTLERQNPPPTEYPQAAAIVLLGGGMAPQLPPRVHPETNGAGDRVIHAARLWKRGLAPVLVATGGYIAFVTDAPGTEADQYARLLNEVFDVPDSVLLRVGRSRTTHEDALFTAEEFEARGLKKDILLVTSAAHMPRAAALFRRQGFTVHAAPTDFNASEGKAFKAFRLLPSGAAMMETYLALNEHVGSLVYRMLGRM
jgi:uncharacterized SAM-binding protein YcdF (DUF218 family)